MSIQAASYGAGVQSTAMLVLAAQGKIAPRLFIFANVGDRAENPETLAYMGKFAVPFARECGIELIQRRWVDRSGRERDLYDDLMSASRTIDIPVRLASGAFGNRKCTERYKIDVVARYLRKRGATVDDPATLAIGISTDEFHRARVGVDKGHPWITRSNPLLDLGLSRADCIRAVTDAGLPQPPKSSCYFCPFQTAEQWRTRRRRQPELFAKAEALEAKLNETRAALGRDRVGLATAAAPLGLAIDDQLVLDGMDGCDSGWCMT